ncbi:ATP-binding protein [Acidianus sp. HS-5]|uniref:AAA family ATPase n=1 Tax=Acidianus sp. HS-5 TaxID=2886040 RepID=UPI001F27801F|nr:ATP-binding protein [Acidianus sp. HS-5]
MAICKLFDPYPKDSRENFFDEEEIISEVEKLLSGKFWPLILGPKRMGKTSILKIVVKELGGIYIDASSIRSIKELGNSILENSVTKFQLDLKIFKVEIEKKPVSTIRSILNKLGNTILAIDEVQNITSPWLISLLSTAYNESEVRFAFTGSMIGLSRALLGSSKGKKLSTQFKGRPIVRIEISPFNEEMSRKFLDFGRQSCGVKMSDDEIVDAVKTYRGIVGWLTYYGNFRSLGYSHEKAKEMVNQIAENLIKDEIKTLGKIEKAIIKALSLVDNAKWSDLKTITESIYRSSIKDWSFNHALEQLILSRIVSKNKEEKEYSLTDPMYKLAKSLTEF